MWVVGSNIADRTVRTGHVVSAVCSMYVGGDDLI